MLASGVKEFARGAQTASIRHFVQGGLSAKLCILQNSHSPVDTQSALLNDLCQLAALLTPDIQAPRHPPDSPVCDNPMRESRVLAVLPEARTPMTR